MKKMFFILSLACYGSLVGTTKQKPTSRNISPTKIIRNKVVFESIPKSGTHLGLACINALDIDGLQDHETGNPVVAYQKAMRNLKQNNPPHHYRGILHVPTMGSIPKGLSHALRSAPKKRLFSTHWPYTPECDRLFQTHTQANFIMIRDPRDQIVSTAFMVQKGMDGETADLDKIIFDLIDGRQKNFIPWGVKMLVSFPLQWELGIVDFYKLYLPWMKAKNFYTIKFEDLVGPDGGSSKEAQLKEIKNIAQHVGVNLSDQQTEEIAGKIFGNSITFRAGKIGGWKKHFTPEMKTAFKRTPGANQLLIDLGYEKDANW